MTGGAGFIGANFVKYMLATYPEAQIIVLDMLTYAGNLGTIKDDIDGRRCHFVKGDIGDRALVEGLFEKYPIRYVVNFAAESHVDRSIEDPQLFLVTNILGTQNLLDAARKAWVTGKDEAGYPAWTPGVRFHQVSTDEVYGDLPIDRPDLLFREDTALCASSPYSASKASADLLVMAYARTYGLAVSISRCSNNYGPYQFPEKLIPLVLSRAESDQSIPVYGTGANIRDWLHVEDHCRAIDLILQKGKDGCIYNIGGHNEKTNLEVVQTILRLTHKPESLIHFVKDRPGHDLRYAMDPTRIETELGWKPVYRFETGIAQTIDWYHAHQPWLDHILSGAYQTYYASMYKDRP